MEYSELGLNRFGKKAEQTTATEDTVSSSANSTDNTFSKHSDNGVDNGKADAKNIVTGTVIVSCIIKTSDGPSRVELSGNDMKLYDNSKGANGKITGDTSTISFIRSDKQPGSFIMQKRHGKDFDLDNVMEMFYTAGTPGRHNFLFIGRRGDDSEYNTNYIEIIAESNILSSKGAANGTVGLYLNRDGVTYQYGKVAIYEADNSPSLGGAGVRAEITGEGDGGGVQLAYFDAAGNNKSYIVLDKDGLQYSAAGNVSSAGVAATKFPPGWSVAYTSTGLYTITHNLGHSNYTVLATAKDNLQAFAGARSVGANTFQVSVVDQSTSNPVDCAFGFAVF